MYQTIKDGLIPFKGLCAIRCYICSFELRFSIEIFRCLVWFLSFSSVPLASYFMSTYSNIHMC